MKTNAKTYNGAEAYEHSEDNLLEFFSKAGSLFVNKGTYYGSESSALELFKVAWRTNNYKAMQLAFWLRNCRGGAGNRSGFRAIIKWLGENYSEWVISNINLIPMYGRWDDLVQLYGTPCEEKALSIWAEAIFSDDPSIYGLACKWADRQDFKLRNFMKLSPKEFRKLLVNKTQVVETLMCQKKWDGVDYNKVPSVAATRYNKAFSKHDADRYDAWKASLSKPESGNKVNAGAIFPHDVIRMVRNDYTKNSNALAEAQFKAIPNFMEGTNARIMPIVDFSGSMCSAVAGSVTAFDVALALGLYCSDAVGKNNPFWRKLIPFSTNSKLESWKDMSLVDAINEIPNGYCGSTDISKAFAVLLEAGKFFNATNDQMPNMLLIMSDMQFDGGGVENKTPVEKAMEKWVEAGYTVPKIVYWNLAGYQTQPATCKTKNVGLVSGFSPAIMKAVLGGDDFSPIGIMNRAIADYSVINPNE